MNEIPLVLGLIGLVLEALHVPEYIKVSWGWAGLFLIFLRGLL